MADTGVTSEGFVLKPLANIRESINAKYKAKYGSGFDTSPESPDGQAIGIMSAVIFDAWLMGEMCFNSNSPSKSFGVGLENLCELNHIRRYFEQPTRTAVIMSGEDGTIIPKGSIVKDTTGLEHATQNELVLDSSGDNAVTVEALVLGALLVGKHSITEIVTEDIVGWTGVDNPEAGVTGVNRETDPQLRNRRNATVITTGRYTSESIYSALSKLGATYVTIIDNDTGEVLDGQPPNTFQVVVEGGLQQEIAQAIYNKKPYGIQAYGEIVTVISDSKGMERPIGFSRTSRLPIYVEVKFKRKPGSSVDSLNLITQALEDYLNSLDIMEDVVWSELFEPITTKVDFISIKSLKIGTSSSTLSTDDIPVSSRQRAGAIAGSVVVVDIDA